MNEFSRGAMQFFKFGKDGGPESNVEGYWLIEWKYLFSIVLLKFNRGTRENYHSHAFNAISWFLWGDLTEYTIDPETNIKIGRRFQGLSVPKYTPRSQIHKFYCDETAWCISIRGPWSDTWQEYNEEYKELITLTHGREIVK